MIEIIQNNNTYLIESLYENLMRKFGFSDMLEFNPFERKISFINNIFDGFEMQPFYSENVLPEVILDLKTYSEAFVDGYNACLEVNSGRSEKNRS